MPIAPSSLPSPAESAEPCRAAGDSRFSPEFRLLLAACALSPETAATWANSALRQADWAQVLRLAEHHGVVPPLFLRCGRLSRDGYPSFAESTPQDARAELEELYHRNVRKTLRLSAELVRVLICLEDADLLAIPHKGPLLSETLYGDLAQRDFSDLDVLVRAREIARAKTALAKIGYKPNSTLTPSEERSFLENGYEYTFDGPAGNNLLELQWNLAPRFFSVEFDMDAMFERAMPASVAGRAVRRLANPDMLLALCVHAAKHLWGRLCWLRDIAALATRPDLDWASILREAQRLGIVRIVAVSMILARDLLGLKPPGDAERLLGADQAALALAIEVARHIPDSEEYSTETIAYIRWMLRLRERRQDRWRFVTRLALTPSLGEWRWIRLPEPLFPVYRGIRALRLSGRFLGLRSR